ncbi:hypothetical protein FK530_22945 [Tsukamurella conjunctivitidis]|uniref:Uncharacterized protein n=1 Tax=Tsukamurella conjunctivitidis TaxID=2592068 RepID=A0A5C5RR90_9ACTN|nr:hypothetical protein [Tsukamurella conjunctivitidis]TWS25579.1 hypothetical protein FK530_22945 [Tsukamurella conjunctivitidis]
MTEWKSNVTDRDGKLLNVGDRVQCGCCGELATVVNDGGFLEAETDSGWRDLIWSNVVLVERAS